MTEFIFSKGRILGAVCAAVFVIICCFLFCNKNGGDPQFGSKCLKLAIVDGSRIKKESQAFLKVLDLEKKAFEDVNEKIRAEYKNLQDILKQSKDLKNSAKARLEYKKQFDQEFAILEPQVQIEKEQLRKRDIVLKQRLNDAVLKVTKDLAKKYKLDIILNANVFETMTVFFSSPRIDLTNEAIALLDKKIKDIIGD
ncbi:MAG: OmpH family outer membrane protein [Holosporales bacterium]|jgi:Skp family chaperone for outer membrane proteins|nr:OmpH family outer membrane protein [Holosporales bacterium]